MRTRNREGSEITTRFCRLAVRKPLLFKLGASWLARRSLARSLMLVGSSTCASSLKARTLNKHALQNQSDLFRPCKPVAASLKPKNGAQGPCLLECGASWLFGCSFNCVRQLEQERIQPESMHPEQARFEPLIHAGFLQVILYNPLKGPLILAHPGLKKSRGPCMRSMNLHKSP